MMDRRTAQLSQINLVPWVVLASACMFAVYLGVVIGETDVLTLVGLTVLIGALIFATFLYRFTWQIGLLLIFLDYGFWFRFGFGANELSCGLAFASILLFVWQKRTLAMPDMLAKERSYVFMQRVLFTWCLFAAIHFYVNYKIPYRPGDFSFGNGIKPYFIVTAPFAALYFFSKNPLPILIRSNFLWRIAQLCFVGVVLNFFFKLWTYAGHRIPTIPIIHGAPGAATFRALGPFAMLLGAIASTSADKHAYSGFQRLVYSSLMLIGALGSLMSGGRATIVFGLALIAMVLWVRQRLGAVALVSVVAIIAFGAVNLFAPFINAHVNEEVQRSLQWVMLEKNWNVSQSISSSTAWRQELFRRAIADWQSDARTVWFGRATYGFGLDDEQEIARRGAFEALLDISLRRGATHNLLTDLLVAYGLIGCAVFFVAYGSLVSWLWRIRRSTVVSTSTSDLALLCFVLSIANLILELTGSASLRIHLVWCTIVLVAAIAKGVGLHRPPSQPSTDDKPPHLPPQLTRAIRA